MQVGCCFLFTRLPAQFMRGCWQSEGVAGGGGGGERWWMLLLKKGLAYSILWWLVCRGRSNKALDLETPPGGHENYPARSKTPPPEWSHPLCPLNCQRVPKNNKGKMASLLCNKRKRDGLFFFFNSYSLPRSFSSHINKQISPGLEEMMQIMA